MRNSTRSPGREATGGDAELLGVDRVHDVAPANRAASTPKPNTGSSHGGVALAPSSSSTTRSPARTREPMRPTGPRRSRRPTRTRRAIRDPAQARHRVRGRARGGLPGAACREVRLHDLLRGAAHARPGRDRARRRDRRSAAASRRSWLTSTIVRPRREVLERGEALLAGSARRPPRAPRRAAGRRRRRAARSRMRGVRSCPRRSSSASRHGTAPARRTRWRLVDAPRDLPSAGSRGARRRASRSRRGELRVEAEAQLEQRGDAAVHPDLAGVRHQQARDMILRSVDLPGSVRADDPDEAARRARSSVTSTSAPNDSTGTGRKKRAGARRALVCRSCGMSVGLRDAVRPRSRPSVVLDEPRLEPLEVEPPGDEHEAREE